LLDVIPASKASEGNVPKVRFESSAQKDMTNKEITSRKGNLEGMARTPVGCVAASTILLSCSPLD